MHTGDSNKQNGNDIVQEGKFRPSAGTEIAAEGEVDSSKNAVPDITADILTAEACNLRICCEKTDHRNGNKLNRNSDDQSANVIPASVLPGRISPLRQL